MMWMWKQKKIFARELHKKAFNIEYYFTEVPSSDGEELIVPAKKYRNSDISEDLIIKLYYRWDMCDDNGDALTSDLPFDEYLSRCQMTYLIKRDEGFEIGYQCTCPVFTLYSICKHTIRLAFNRNGLDLHLDLDCRSLGRKAKRGIQKRKDQGVIRTLNFNFVCGLFVSRCL